MVHLQVADGGDDLQMWSVASDVLIKLSQVANNGFPSDLALNGGLTHHCKKLPCYVMSYKGSDRLFGIGTSGGLF